MEHILEKGYCYSCKKLTDFYKTETPPWERVWNFLLGKEIRELYLCEEHWLIVMQVKMGIFPRDVEFGTITAQTIKVGTLTKPQ